MKKLKKSSFIEGAFIATSCIIITKILGIIYVIPFYKIIGEQGGILYGYAYNIYNIFLILSSAGIPLAISKLTSEYNTLGLKKEKKRMYELTSKIILVFSSIAFLICFIFAPQLSNIIIGSLEGGNTIEDVTFVIRLISFSLLIIPFLSIERGYLQGHQYILEPSISQVIEQIVRIAIILIGSYTFTYVFKLPIKYAVGISTFAAFIGGLVTFFYLHKTIKRNKNQIGLNEKVEPNKKMDKEIVKKVITYSLPFIIINLAHNLYISTDMILIIRTLPQLGFSAMDTEFIGSVFTTWGAKFDTIIISIQTGIIISLIPCIVKNYVENNMEEVNNNFNKCLKIILLIIAPLAVYLSGMSKSLWSLFYGPSVYGPKIIKYTLLVAIFMSLYMAINSLMQSLNKTKLTYISVFSGLIANLILDVPLMKQFSKMNIPAYYGAIAATFIGFFISNTINLVYLHKKMNFEYKETVKIFPRFIISIIILLFLGKLFNTILPIDSSSKMMQLLNLVVSGLISGGIYLAINYKNIKEILPDKIKKSLKLK